MSRFQNKHVLVFGGGAGIGLAVAQEVVESAGKVTLIGRREETLVKAVNSLGRNADYAVADFSDEKQLEELSRKYASFDHLVLCASSSVAFGPFDDISEKGLKQALDNKFVGYWLATQRLYKNIAKDGSIVMVTGAAHRSSIAGMSAVAAVNGAIAAFAQVVAVELAPLRVNVVSPGMVDTHAYSYLPDDVREQVYNEAASKLPLGKIGTPKGIAEMITSVLDSEFMTGSIIDIDGGVHLAKG